MRDAQEPPTQWRATAIAAIAVLAPALGGSTRIWTQAVLLLAMAALIFVAPPRHSAGPVWNTLFVALFATALAAFVPADWIGIPEWRRALAANFQVGFPSTASPQPWISAEAACVLFAGMVFAYYVMTQAWNAQSRGRAFRVYAVGILILAIAALVSLRLGQKVPFWPKTMNLPSDFGFFPNRNQTANVLALAGVVAAALAYESFRKRRNAGWFWITALLVLGTAQIYAFSRAGILLLFGGITAWLVVTFASSRSGKGAAIGAAAVALLLTLFFVFGGKTFDRLQQAAQVPSADFRIPLQADALRLAAAAPWFGQGIGNFDGVFAMARSASAAQNRAIHPESDWLWVAAEMGWPAAILLFGMFLLWLKQFFPFSPGSDRPGRSAAMVCGVMFAIHSFIDVSGHRPGSALPALLLAGLALHPARRLRPARWVAPCFRLLAMVLVAIASWWVASILSERVAQVAPTSHNLSRLLQQIDDDNAGAAALLREGRAPEAIARYESAAGHLTEALRMAPLKGDLYYQRGVVRVAADAPPLDAMRDFRIARFLDPNRAGICFFEGKVWLLAGRSGAVIEAWTEALDRAGKDAPSLYREMLFTLAIVKRDFTVRNALRELARANPEYLITFLDSADSLECDIEIGRLLDADPSLKLLSASQRKRLFAVWFARGDRADLAYRLKTVPGWMEDGWQSLAAYRAREKQFESAWRLAKQFGAAPTLPRFDANADIEKLAQTFHSRPQDFASGMILFSAQKEAGRTDDALATLRALQAIPNCPSYVAFLESELLAGLGQWEGAWTAWQRFAGNEKR